MEPPLPQINSVHVNGDQTLALLAGPQGGVVYSLDSHTEERRISQEDDIIERAIWVADRIALGTTSGSVKIIEEDGKEAMSFKAHAGRVEAMVVHPSGELLVSVGSDNSFVVYDLQQGKIAIRKRVDAGKEFPLSSSKNQTLTSRKDLRDAAIHPDGALLAIGDSAGHIRVFDLIECTEQAVFDGTGAISRLEFSENGIWLAAASTGESSISIWDLRKMSLLHSITLSGEIRDIRWDYTGQHLAVAGSEGVSVQHYSKAKKSWSEPFRVGSPCRLLAWGAQARSLVALADSQALIGFGEQ